MDWLGIDAIKSDLGDFLDTMPIIGQARIAKRNLALQKDVFKYQKGIQERMFSREDTSYQRGVSDLKAAGLSPMLIANAKAGAGPVVSTQAPQRGSNESILGYMNLVKMKADISLTEAQKELMRAQAAKFITEAGNIFTRKKHFEKDVAYFGHGYGPTFSSKFTQELFSNPAVKSVLKDIKARFFGGSSPKYKAPKARKPRKGGKKDLEIMNKAMYGGN